MAFHANGIMTATEYDDNGNITQVRHIDDHGNVVASFVYERDELDRIEKVIAMEDDIEVITTFTYLPTGELASESVRVDGALTTHRFQYDNSGNRTRQVITGEHRETIEFFYNDLNQLVQTHSSIDGRTDFEYDLDGNLISRANNGIIRTYYHDMENRVIQVRENGALLLANQFDGDGNRTAAIDRMEYVFTIEREHINREQAMPERPWHNITNPSPTSPPWRINPDVSAPQTLTRPERQTDTYDVTYQITRTYDIYTREINYWTVFWHGFGMAASGIMFLGIGMAQNTRAFRRWFEPRFDFYTYVRRETKEIVTTQYDERDWAFMELMGLTDRDFQMIGRPVQNLRINPGVNPNINNPAPRPPSGEVADWEMSPPLAPDLEVRYFFQISYFVNSTNRENAQVMATYGNRNQRMNTYTLKGDVRLTDERLSLYHNENVTDTFLHDGRTSVIATTDETGQLVRRFRYDAFGNMTYGKPAQGTVFGFNGELYHIGVGYQFLRARFYAKEFARFLTRDTFLGWEDVPLSHNRYSYVHNDPVNHIDPNGHWASDLVTSQWDDTRERLIRLGYRNAYHQRLAQRGGNERHVRHAVDRFRATNGLSNQVGRAFNVRDATWNALRRSNLNSPQGTNLVDPEMRTAQRRLNELGFGRGMAITGGMGPITGAALDRFRRTNGLQAGTHSIRFEDATWNRLVRDNPRAPVSAQGNAAANNSLAQPGRVTPAPTPSGGTQGGNRAPTSSGGNGGSGATSNQNSAGNAAAQTGPKYEPPVGIRILGQVLEIPLRIYDVFAGRNGQFVTPWSSEIDDLVLLLIHGSNFIVNQNNGEGVVKEIARYFGWGYDVRSALMFALANGLRNPERLINHRELVGIIAEETLSSSRDIVWSMSTRNSIRGPSGPNQFIIITENTGTRLANSAAIKNTGIVVSLASFSLNVYTDVSNDNRTFGQSASYHGLGALVGAGVAVGVGIGLSAAGAPVLVSIAVLAGTSFVVSRLYEAAYNHIPWFRNFIHSIGDSIDNHGDRLRNNPSLLQRQVDGLRMWGGANNEA